MRYQQEGGKLVAAYGIDRKTGKIVKKKPRKQAKKNRK
jgi:hypothetical protein